MISSIRRWLIFDLWAICHMMSGSPASSSALKTAFLSCTPTTVAAGFAGAGGHERFPVEAALLVGHVEDDASAAVLGRADCRGGCCAVEWGLVADA